MQAIAFAGGLNLYLDPRYVTIYRQDASGEIVSATFSLNDKSLAKASSIKIKAGDVINVQQTPTTRVKVVLRDLLYFRLGYDLSRVFDDD